MNDNITLVLHHGGRFTPRASDGKVEYIGGEFDVWEDISADCLNAFILYDLVKAYPILEEVPQMLYLECDPIRKAVENEDDLDDVPVAGHEEDVGAGEQTDAGEQMDAGKQRDGGEQRDTDAGEQRHGSDQRDTDGEERDVADSEEEKEVDSDETDAEWFINFSCMLNEVEAEVETDVTKMWRAMKEAKQLVEGNERKQYAKVFDYAHELLRSNPGSTVKINTVPSPEDFVSCIFGKNFTKQWKSKELKGIVWQCAKSTTVAEFEGHMAHLKTINCQAWEYLNKWPKQAWTKAHFSTIPKVDNICNNTCEVFNSRILHYRCKPIITMLEEIRSYIMRTMAARKVKLSGKPGPLCPVQYKRLEKEFHFANQWTPIWCGDNMGLRYEVHMWGNKVEVNLGEWTCTCGVWQLTGMPCRHAIATITHKGGKPEDMCHEWLSIEAYNKTYQHFIEPVQGPQYWAQTQYTHPVPPHKKVQRGRPKKNRRRSVDEDNVTGHKLKRKLAEFTCGRCGQTNHNIRSCKNIGVPVRPKKYVAPSTSNEDDHLLSQDEQALNEAEEAAAHVQQDPVEINLSQPHLSQDSDMEFMVPATIVPPIARNKLAITRAKKRKVADKDDAEN
ncbi:hypothetical protein GmHk_06G017020 [Glycine max]|nr:hypothetical protein GmHk_06G017020 [Glycine max]